MRIVDLEVIILRRPEVAEVGDSSQDLLLVELRTDDGLTGLGEADSSPEVVASAIQAPLSHEVCRGLAPVVVGRDPFTYEAIWLAMYRASLFYGRGGAAMQAMSAIDLALWDLMGKATGRPVHDLLGGALRDRVRTYASLLMPEHADEVEGLVEQARAEGFSAVKFGWGGLGRSLADDEQLIAAAQNAAHAETGRTMDVMIDMGSHGWARDFREVEAFAVMLARHRVYWLEEPFAPDDVASYRRLRVPGLRIATGEEECTAAGFDALLATEGVDVIQPDPARAGGLTASKRIAWRAAERGVALAPHAWSSPVVRAAAVHLSFAAPTTLIQEYSRHETPLSVAFRTTIVSRDGWLEPPTAPGLGVELDRQAGERFRVG